MLPGFMLHYIEQNLYLWCSAFIELLKKAGIFNDKKVINQVEVCFSWLQVYVM